MNRSDLERHSYSTPEGDDEAPLAQRMGVQDELPPFHKTDIFTLHLERLTPEEATVIALLKTHYEMAKYSYREYIYQTRPERIGGDSPTEQKVLVQTMKLVIDRVNTLKGIHAALRHIQTSEEGNQVSEALADLLGIDESAVETVNKFVAAAVAAQSKSINEPLWEPGTFGLAKLAKPIEDCELTDSERTLAILLEQEHLILRRDNKETKGLQRLRGILYAFKAIARSKDCTAISSYYQGNLY